MTDATKSDKVLPWLPSSGLLLLLTLLLLALSILWRWGAERVTAPYEQVLRTDPACVEHLCLTVDYPRMLSRTDRGIQPRKRLVVHVASQIPESGTVTLAVVLQSKAVRLLDGEGSDASGYGQTAVTQGIGAPVVYYLEHTGVETKFPIPLSVDVLTPTVGVTAPQARVLSLSIEQETVWHRWVRELIQTTLPVANLGIVLIGALATSLKWVWERAVPHLDRFQQTSSSMREAVERDRYGDAQRIYEEHQREYGRFWWLVSRQVRQIQSLQRNADERALYEQTLSMLEGALRGQEIDWGQVEDRLACLKRKHHQPRSDCTALEEIARWQAALANARDLALVRTPAGSGVDDLSHVAAQRRQGRPGWVWIDRSRFSLEVERLRETLQDARSPTVVACWAVRLLAHDPSPEIGPLLLEQLTGAPEAAVQAEAAWGLARKARGSAVLSSASPDTVLRWLSSMPSPWNCNPFEVLSAREEYARVQQGLPAAFVSLGAYEQLKHARHTALFAASGCGKTTFCLQLEQYYKGMAKGEQPVVVEYSAFDWRHAFSIEHHVGYIVQQALANLREPAPAELPSGGAPGARLSALVHLLRERGYPHGLQVLVDGLNAWPEGHKDVERLARVLVDRQDILDIPGLGLHFFLPLDLLDRLGTCRCLQNGQIKVILLRWSVDDLTALLEEKVRSVTQDPFDFSGLVHGMPVHFRKQMARWLSQKADGSPRRLIYLVNLLFQHRAAQWDAAEAGGGDRGSEENQRIQFEDLACLLEWLIQDDPAHKAPRSHAS